MPFERYLRPQSNEHASPHTRNPTSHPATYTGYGAHAERIDSFGLDAQIFSQNVQFQMPQLMLGPTVAPGGGAEVLPAGIVGQSGSAASTWLTTPRFARYADH